MRATIKAHPTAPILPRPYGQLGDSSLGARVRAAVQKVEMLAHLYFTKLYIDGQELVSAIDLHGHSLPRLPDQ